MAVNKESEKQSFIAEARQAQIIEAAIKTLVENLCGSLGMP
jgi:hypothetical protein